MDCKRYKIRRNNACSNGQSKKLFKFFFKRKDYKNIFNFLYSYYWLIVKYIRLKKLCSPQSVSALKFVLDECIELNRKEMVYLDIRFM